MGEREQIEYEYGQTAVVLCLFYLFFKFGFIGLRPKCKIQNAKCKIKDE